MKAYYVYILASSKNGTIYIGVTDNLRRRVQEHTDGDTEGFTKKYSVKSLVYFEETSSIEAAIAREKQLKHWNRAWKIELIERENPGWRNLSADWE